MTSYKARLMNKNQAYRSLNNRWKYALINVTAITEAGSPITTQLWRSSLADVECSVSRWAKSDSIFRVFTQIIDDERGSSLVEWKWWGGSQDLDYLDTLEVHAPPLLDEANTSRAAD